jgi:hypothetical protein
MGLERDMVDGARTATGDEILVAGLFTLMGGTARYGSTSGSNGAHGRDTHGGTRGGGGNTGHRRARGQGLLLRSLASTGTGAPGDATGSGPRLVVAVSPTRVYLLRRAEADDDRLWLAHTFDRRRVDVSIHARQDARTLTLEDTWTRERFELDGERSPEAHVTATMHALSEIHELAS